jgi:membrane fusion protein (multidrug efflux system)
VQKARANLAATKAHAARFEPLVSINAVSKQDYDNAVSQQGQAEAEVASGIAQAEIARINLGYTTVTSPITGRSGISHVTQGAYVQSGQATLMTTVQQIDPMYVDLTQSSLQGLELRRDAANGKVKLAGTDQATVTLTLEDGRPYPHKGRLEFSDITVDQTTGAVTVRAVMPNPDSTLLPGMFVHATIHAGQFDNVYLVPQAGDNKVVARTLQVRGINGNNWIVDGGLNEGDRVVVAGLQRIRPGVVVQASELPAPTVAKND